MIRNRFAAPAAIAALAFFAATAPAHAQQGSQTGQVVTTHQERLYVIPGTKAVVAGYFTQIAGLDGPMFAGEPGETTAMFTFYFESPTAYRLVNGDITTVVFAPGTSFNIYYDPKPNRTWSDPASFTTGTLVASYKNSIGTSATAGPVTIAQQASQYSSSTDFTFQGVTINLNQFLPAGFVTAGVIQGAQNLGPSAGFPLVFALSGSHVSLGANQNQSAAPASGAAELDRSVPKAK